MNEDVNFLNLLFNELEKNNIKYAVMRKAENLYTGVFNDIDWAIDFNYYLKFNEILKKVCIKLNWKVEMRIQKDGFEAIRLHSVGNKIPYLLHFDLFNSFSWKGIVIFNNNELLNNRYKINGVYSTSKPVEAMIQFLTRYLFNGYIKKEYRSNIKNIFNEEKKVVKEKLNNIFMEGDSDKLLNLIYDSKWNLVEKQVEYFKKSIINKQKKENKILFYKNKFKYKFYNLSRCLKKPGLMIVFEGTDGSGKSTIIDNLPKILYRSYDESYIDYYHWRPKIIKSPKKETKSDYTNPHKNKLYSKPVSLAKFLFFNIDYILGYYCKVRWQLAKGRIVVFDRYYYDYYLDKLRYRLNINDYLLDICKVFIPKPDVTFLLIGQADVIYERKKEISIEEIQNQIDRLIKNEKKFKNSVEIDVNQAIDDVIGDTCNEILNCLTVKNKL